MRKAGSKARTQVAKKARQLVKKIQVCITRNRKEVRSSSVEMENSLFEFLSHHLMCTFLNMAIELFLRQEKKQVFQKVDTHSIKG
ncbi:hypothetical protein [Lysinibacillus sp. JNUCC 51]|uniref:hypothetical protein n=1 Tax=Lysinibacillus sp. JNUCC-51 TaxID=2792479 RepID=UPI0019369592|nr:hypothetical protein JNUCC51_00185 [Lysinibacillus sp. JNUCC-51]